MFEVKFSSEAFADLKRSRQDIEDFNEEIVRTRKNEKLMAFLERRGKQAATISFKEAKQILGI